MRNVMRQWVGYACWLPARLRRMVMATSSSKESFEVERKYKISRQEHAELPEKLISMGFTHEAQVHMYDTFLPTAVESDMCRVRDETIKDRTKHLLTQKVWVQVSGNRERKEKEEEISTLVRETLLDIGLRLNGKALSHFSKDREMYVRSDDLGRQVTIALDITEGLKQYDGTYMEIEFLVADERDVESARQSIKKLVQEVLGEARLEWELSYMQMLRLSQAES
jgi:adenylate cyclase class IV